MSTEPIVVEKIFNAPVDKVWKAITDKDQMKEWYFDVSGFRAEVGYQFRFEGNNEGKVFIHKCVITEVLPNKKLTYTWSYEGFDGTSYLTFELFPEGKRTRLLLTHAGLETFPSLPDFARSNFVGGWDHIINTSLKNFLEKN